MRPDEKGRYHLLVDEQQELLISDLTPGVAFSSSFAAVPKDREEPFMEEMLLANLFGQGTGGAVLGLSGEGKSLTLSLEFDYPLEYKDFKDSLENILNALEFWNSEATKPAM